MIRKNKNLLGELRESYDKGRNLAENRFQSPNVSVDGNINKVRIRNGTENRVEDQMNKKPKKNRLIRGKGLKGKYKGIF